MPYTPRDASLLRPVVLSRLDASSFDVLLALQTLRIAIHRRKGTILKLLFIVMPFFGGCLTLFKDREVVLPAIVAAGARASLVFATSARGFPFYRTALPPKDFE